MSDAPSAQEPPEILIVEDSGTQADLLRHLLECQGHRVAAAADGLGALARIEERRPQLVISDIVMPGMDGYELCRIIKTDARLKDIPVILLTALSDSKAVLKGLACGADNFVTQPYDRTMLLSRIEYLMHNRELRRRHPSGDGVEVEFGGERFHVTSERQQILDLLLSIYDTATRQNAELVEARDALQELNATLEERVDVRTADLAAAETAMRRVNRALFMVSQCNQAMVRAADEPELLRDLCATIADTAEYRLVWVGLAGGAGSGPLRAAASAGDDDGYVALAIGAGADAEDEPARRCLRLGETVLVTDTALEPTSPWREEALRRGYRSLVALPLREDGRVTGVLSIAGAEPGLFSPEERGLLAELADDLAYGIRAERDKAHRRVAEAEREAALTKLRHSLENTIRTMATILEVRDPYTAGHQQRVARLATAIAEAMGLPAGQVEGIHFGALIHDIGKIYVPAEILSRPTRLSPLELQMVRSHAQVGHDIVRDIDLPWPVGQMILQHHERLDGSGYPNGLQGDAIIPEARILAVADVVEAMSSHRPYRAGLGVDAALAAIETGRGRIFDEAAVDACLHLFRQEAYSLAD